jgi:hypothetical protein
MFVRVGLAVFPRTSLRQKSNRNPAHCIVQRVRHHPRPQTLPPLRQNPKQQSIHRDHDRRLHALINVASAKHRRGCHQSSRRAPAPRNKLLLQISPKYCLLAKSRGDTNQNPQGNLRRPARRHEINARLRPSKMHCDRRRSQNHQCHEPKANRNPNVARKVQNAFPLRAGHFIQRHPAPSHAPQHVPRQHPLPGCRREVERRSVRMLRGSQLPRREIHHASPTQQNRQQHKGVQDTRDRSIRSRNRDSALTFAFQRQRRTQSSPHQFRSEKPHPELSDTSAIPVLSIRFATVKNNGIPSVPFCPPPTPFVSASTLHVRALYFGAGDIRN